MGSGYHKRLFILILVSTILRLITAASVELGNDEVYYWIYAQKLQWNYFDHPPMVAVWIRLFTANLLLENSEIFLRLGSITSCALSTLILFHTVTRLHSEKAGWLTACLYNASLYGSIIAGVFIMPDSPQMLFWCCCLFLLVSINKAPSLWWNWILFGLAAGLCIMSKVHGVFLWFGFGLFIIFYRRGFFRLPQLYVAAVLTALIASPILLWNIENDFITYKFHSERVTVEKFVLNGTGFAREFFGQIFYNNPVNVFLSVASLFAWRKERLNVQPALKTYALIALPMIIILLAVSLFRNTFPHWSGPAYITLLPLAGIYLAEQKHVFPPSVKWALGFSLFVVILGIGLINFYPGTLGKKSETELGKGDFTLDMHGWRSAGKVFGEIRQKEVSAGLMSADAPLISYKWFPAAHEDYYFSRPLGLEMLAFGSEQDLHHYLWTNTWRIPKADMTNAWCIVPSNERFDVKEKFSHMYSRIDSLTLIEDRRSGKMARKFIVYTMKHPLGPPKIYLNVK
jgi:4-amino-4-deoxy-L-arabinose transferase-like glycosyltransferase